MCFVNQHFGNFPFSGHVNHTESLNPLSLWYTVRSHQSNPFSGSFLSQQIFSFVRSRDLECFFSCFWHPLGQIQTLFWVSWIDVFRRTPSVIRTWLIETLRSSSSPRKLRYRKDTGSLVPSKRYVYLIWDVETVCRTEPLLKERIRFLELYLWSTHLYTFTTWFK